MESTMNLSLVQEIEISYRNTVKPSLRPQISSASDIVPLLRETWDLSKIEHVEQVKLILLNHSNRVLGILEIATGGFTSCIVDPRVIFGAALKAAATKIILAHNHPSGSLQPSQADINISAKLASGGKLLDIEVLDHIILTSEAYYSLKEEGLF